MKFLKQKKGGFLKRVRALGVPEPLCNPYAKTGLVRRCSFFAQKRSANPHQSVLNKLLRAKMPQIGAIQLVLVRPIPVPAGCGYSA
jgi:hypothetical protein